MSQSKRVTLADVVTRSEVELPSGRVAAVRPFSATEMPLLREWNGGVNEHLWKLATLALPDVPEEEVRGFTASQALVVVGLARELIDEVEKFIAAKAPKGNAEAPPG